MHITLAYLVFIPLLLTIGTFTAARIDDYGKGCKAYAVGLVFGILIGFLIAQFY